MTAPQERPLSLRRLRIVHAIDSLQIGGTEWQCVSLATGLDRERFSSSVVVLGSDGPLSSRLSEGGVLCHRHRLPGFRRLTVWKSILDLARWLRANQFDIMQTYGIYSNVPSLLAAVIARLPIRVASRRDMGEFLTPRQWVFERWIFRLAHRVVVNAGAIRDQLVESRQTPAGKIAVIPTGVDLSRFGGSDSDEAWGWSGRTRVVVMVAKFRPQKDHAAFLQAAARVLAAEPETLFVLGGDGELLSEHRLLARRLGIERSVRFAGRVEPAQIPSLLRSASIFAMISRGNEGVPNAVLEAMAASRAVVATDTGGCREAVVDGLTGFLVAPGAVEEIAEKLLRLLRDPDRAAAMGRAGRERVEEHFSMESMIARFSALYQELAAERGVVL